MYLPLGLASLIHLQVVTTSDASATRRAVQLTGSSLFGWLIVSVFAGCN